MKTSASLADRCGQVITFQPVRYKVMYLHNFQKVLKGGSTSFIAPLQFCLKLDVMAGAAAATLGHNSTTL